MVREHIQFVSGEQGQFGQSLRQDLLILAYIAG
jgi:hypothetical protein